MAEDRQTVAGAYAKIEGHEALCFERYRSINEKLRWILSGLVMIFLGLLGWSMVQLYTLEPLRVSAQQRPVNVGVSVQQPSP
jgi:hypothetical protein